MTRALTPSAVLEPVDGRDVRMIQRREDFRFALEPRHSFRVSRDRLWQDLDGDIAIELRVARAIYLAHATGAEGGDNLVRTEARASGQWHESRLILVMAPNRAKEKRMTPLARHPALFRRNCPTGHPHPAKRIPRSVCQRMPLRRTKTMPVRHALKIPQRIWKQHGGHAWSRYLADKDHCRRFATRS